MKVVTIVGARPKFIKAAAVSREVRCLNLDLDAPLPAEFTKGPQSYKQLKQTNS